MFSPLDDTVFPLQRYESYFKIYLTDWKCSWERLRRKRLYISQKIHCTTLLIFTHIPSEKNEHFLPLGPHNVFYLFQVEYLNLTHCEVVVYLTGLQLEWIPWGQRSDLIDSCVQVSHGAEHIAGLSRCCWLLWNMPHYLKGKNGFPLRLKLVISVSNRCD